MAALRLVLVCGLLLASGAARAADRAEVDARFDHLLRTIDTLVDRPALEAGIPDAWQRLVAVAEDTTAAEWPRRRAISLLAMYPDAPTRQALERVARDPEPAIRAQALTSLAMAFGAAGDRAVAEQLAQAAAEDASPKVRDRAVRGLGRCTHPLATETLRRIAGRPADGKLQALATTLLQRRERTRVPVPPARTR